MIFPQSREQPMLWSLNLKTGSCLKVREPHHADLKCSIRLDTTWVEITIRSFLFKNKAGYRKKRNQDTKMEKEQKNKELKKKKLSAI